MGKKTEQPESKPAEGQGITDAAADVIATPTPDRVTELLAAQSRDMTLLCDGCKDRLKRAHAEDERNRNAVYPEGVTP